MRTTGAGACIVTTLTRVTQTSSFRWPSVHIGRARCTQPYIAPEGHMSDDRYRWLERGEGEPVILLHGLMGHMDHWDATLDGLADTARLLAPELPLLDDTFPDVSLTGLAAYVRDF